MSSILKALKNLENIQPPDSGDQARPHKINPKRVINRRIKGPFLINRIFLVMLTTAFLATFGWLTMLLLPVLERAFVSPTTAREGPHQETRVASAPPPSLPKGVNPTVVSAKRPSPSPTKNKKPSLPKPVSTQRRLNPSGLKVDAIVWSKNPESRFTVINSRILRVGNTIGGGAVTRIGRDHVAIQLGGMEFKLKFRSRE